MRLLVALAGLSVVIGLAGTARADPDEDAAFISSLQAAGITYSDADQAIMTAKAMCRLMTDGKSAPQVLVILQARNPELGSEHGTQFIGMAARSYCPDQLVSGEPAPSAPQ